MRKAVGAAAGALLFLSLAPAAVDAGKRIVPARIAQARYVALGYDLGDRFLSETEAITDPDVLPEERRALQAIPTTSAPGGSTSSRCGRRTPSC